MYFHQLLGAACTRMLVEIFILSRFQLFSSFKHFSVIFCLKSRRNCILSYSLKLVDMQMLLDSMRRSLKFIFFSSFLCFSTFFLDFSQKSLKKLEIMKKGCKQLKISSQLSGAQQEQSSAKVFCA